jgi:hypothetical protein
MRIFVGWDPKQQAASEVCKYSIHRQQRYYIETVDLKKADMEEAGYYFRNDDSPHSTEFTYLRFLVPFLCDYSGWAFFVDSDFIFNYDVSTILDRIIWDKHADKTAVYCVKHPMYQPKNTTKFYGETQHMFPKKNWSSLMLFNCEHPSCKNLTPMSVSNRSPQWLHRFEWCDESEIGELDDDWNFLVGEYEAKNGLPRGIHFTNGGPFNGVWGQDYEHKWLDLYREMTGLTFSNSSMDFKI